MAGLYMAISGIKRCRNMLSREALSSAILLLPSVSVLHCRWRKQNNMSALTAMALLDVDNFIWSWEAEVALLEQ